MSKYENVLNMNSDNSAALILKNVNENSVVLEFGADNGYMTKYLKEKLNCKVNIVEINSKNAIEASKYAESSLIGNIYGDIERYNWVGQEKYDHILFADVLEHLFNPYKVLREASKLLKPNGTILISVPNISHNSIIIDLINNNFEYRETGLLDNTHIKLFARKNLRKMVSDAGLYIAKEVNTVCEVEHTEFKNSYVDVEPEIETMLRNRKDGNIYQFVWALTNKGNNA